MSEKIVVPSDGIDIKGFFDINGTAPTEKEIEAFKGQKVNDYSKAASSFGKRTVIGVFFVFFGFLGMLLIERATRSHDVTVTSLCSIAAGLFLIFGMYFCYTSIRKADLYNRELSRVKIDLLETNISKITAESESEILSNSITSRYLHQILTQPRLPTHYEMKILRDKARLDGLIKLTLPNPSQGNPA